MIQAYSSSGCKQTSALHRQQGTALAACRVQLRHAPDRNWIDSNPTRGIQFFPVDKRIKYVPPKEDVLRVILAADPDTQDYLWTIALTMGRMSEINRLTWQDVNLEQRYVVLYTRKKRGGHRTPRKVPMADKLFEMLSRRYKNRDKRNPVGVLAPVLEPEEAGMGGRALQGAKADHDEALRKGRREIFPLPRPEAFWGISCSSRPTFPSDQFNASLGTRTGLRRRSICTPSGIRNGGRCEVLDENFSENSHTESHTKTKGLQT